MARSDLYSLGVVLYEALTGKLPFTATDPSELLHSHLARQAVPPAEVDLALPVLLSELAFCIYFPEGREGARTAVEPAGRASPEAYRGSETILVVEDEDAVRKFLRQALIAQGYQVLESRNGVEALHVLEQTEQQIDLVVTDLIMPDMGGRDLAKHVRVHHPALPVVYTSGYSKDMGDYQEALANAEYFLPKPFGPLDLARKVREVLERTRQGA